MSAAVEPDTNDRRRRCAANRWRTGLILEDHRNALIPAAAALLLVLAACADSSEQLRDGFIVS